MIQCKHGQEKEISITLDSKLTNFTKYFCNEKLCNVNPEYCKECEFIEPKNIKHYMIGCSEECLRFACCDFCLYANRDFFFAEDKEDNVRIVTSALMDVIFTETKSIRKLPKDVDIVQIFIVQWRLNKIK